MKPLRSTAGIRDAYSRRILSNVIGVDVMRTLAATPGEIRRITRGLSRRELFARGPGGEWPIAYLLFHLCDAEWAVGFRIRMVIAQPGRRLQAYDQDKWAAGLHYASASWKEKLVLFTELRRSHLVLLRRLSAAEWRRYGIHEERGKESLERMARMLAGHDINHLRQMKALRARLRNRPA
jgi:hypothetical protein